MRHFNILIGSLLFLLLINSCKEKRSDSLNLDFELIDPKTKTPINWIIGPDPDYKFSLDSSMVYNGKYSVKLENIRKPTRRFQKLNGIKYMTNAHAEKSIKLSGFIKTENTIDSYIGLFVGYNSFQGDSLKILSNPTLIGTNDWKEFTISIPVTIDPNYFFIGFCLTGEGILWIDNLKLYIDNKQVSKTQPLNFKANRSELEWLKTHCIPIKTSNAESGLEDLEPLRKIIGDAKIVALGENTHGSSEVYTMKHRLIEFLVTKMNFTIFSLEASLPEAYLLNDYVLQGNGDHKVLLSGMHFWICNTQEVLNIVTWMRKFNTAGKGPIQFTGFDMQYPDLALNNLLNFFEKNDNNLKTKLDSISVLMAFLKTKDPKNIEGSNDLKILKQRCDTALSLIIRHKANYLRTVQVSEYNLILQNAIVLNQYVTSAVKPAGDRFFYRDECMAKNIELILENNPDTKIILWSHNAHVANQKGYMGNLLKDKFGDKYFSIGFLSNSGTYTAKRTVDVMSNNVLEEGKPGSFEYSFHRLDLPYFLFDFKQLDTTNHDSNWLSRSLNYRSIGALATNEQFIKSNISKLYSSIIYIDSTHASKCFNVTK
jgi:erythromycin esterase